MTLGSVENMLIRESECSMLLRVNAVAGIMGRGGGVGFRVNVISVRFYVVYVYFLLSCVHAAVKTLCAQLSQVFYLSSLVLGWEQALFLVDELMSVIRTHPQKYPII